MTVLYTELEEVKAKASHFCKILWDTAHDKIPMERCFSEFYLRSKAVLEAVVAF